MYAVLLGFAILLGIYLFAVPFFSALMDSQIAFTDELRQRKSDLKYQRLKKQYELESPDCSIVEWYHNKLMNS